MPIKLTTTTERGKKEKIKKNPKEPIEQVKKIKIINVFLEKKKKNKLTIKKI